MKTDRPSPDTVVLTFLIADVRGYTSFTREHGDTAAARLAKTFADLARDAVEARGGRIEFSDGPDVVLSGGDLISIPAGLPTTWHVTTPFKEMWVQTGT